MKDKTSIPKDLFSYDQFAGEKKSKTSAESGWNASYGKCYIFMSLLGLIGVTKKKKTASIRNELMAFSDVSEGKEPGLRIQTEMQ